MAEANTNPTETTPPAPQTQAPVAPQVTSPAPPPARDRRPILISGVLLAVIVLVAAAAFWRTHNKSGQEPTIPPGFSSYKLAGHGTGRGISFIRPDNLSLDTSPGATSLPDHVGMAHTTSGHTDDYIAAASPITSAAAYKTFNAPAVAKELSNPGGDNFPTYISPPEFFAMNIAQGSNIQFAAAHPFTNDSIRANAWQVGMTLTSKSTSRTGRGTLLYILGKNGYYYFMLEANSDYWQAHSKDWPVILNSIQVDQ